MESSASGPTAPTKSLAILYFRNRSGSRDDDYFRDGVTEDIIIELSRIPGLSVLSLASVRPYRDADVPPIRAGEELGASFVLDGGFRKNKKRLSLSVELVDVGSTRVIWAERYDREARDVFAIQREIAQKIAGALQVVMSEERQRAIARAPTTEIEAYDLYLRGRQHFRLFRRKSIEFAGEMFERAVEIDPDYAAAHAGLADCYSYLCMFWDSTEDRMEAADRASRRAVELDAGLAEAHVARGVAIALRKKHDEAEKAFRTAIRLNPNLFEAYYFFARGYYAQGKLDRAVYWFRQACEARPEDYQAPTLLGSALRGLGLKGQSDDAYRQSVDLAEKHLDVNPGDTRAIYFCAIALTQLGRDRPKALEFAERALAMDPQEPQVLYNVACVFALQGMPDRALDCLEQTLPHGDLWLGWMQHDPDLEVLHDQPRYQALLQRRSA